MGTTPSWMKWEVETRQRRYVKIPEEGMIVLTEVVKLKVPIREDLKQMAFIMKNKQKDFVAHILIHPSHANMETITT